MGNITRSGAYVIQPTSMKSLSFVEFIRSYNFIDDYSKVEALVDQLFNAVKYTPQGGSIRLTVNESLLPDGKIRLLYRVADTGLVLPIVKQLVDLMKVPSPATVLLEKAQLLPSLWLWRNPVLKIASISALQAFAL